MVGTELAGWGWGLGVGCVAGEWHLVLPPPHGSVWGQDIPNVSGLQSLNRLH